MPSRPGPHRRPTSPALLATTVAALAGRGRTGSRLADHGRWSSTLPSEHGVLERRIADELRGRV